MNKFVAALLLVAVTVGPLSRACADDDVAAAAPPAAAAPAAAPEAAPPAADPDGAPAKVDRSKETKRCINCHDDPELTNEAGESMQFFPEPFHASVHAKTDCTDCHIDARTIKHPKNNLGPVQLGDCAACHEKEIKTLQASAHAKKKNGNPLDVESCSGCHEPAHEMKDSKKDPEATAHPDNSVETCGGCHKPAKKAFMKSAHGEALKKAENGELKKDEKAPTCYSCHGGHDVHKPPLPFAVKQKLTNECGGCHEKRFETFEDGFHGKATSLGRTESATCADCHAPHDVLPVSDPKSTVHMANRAETCGKCHEAEVKNEKFLTFNPHSDPKDPNDNFWVHWIWVFMTALLIGVFGFFGLHMLLWLQRTLVGKLRGEFPAHSTHGPWVKRFSNVQIWLHVSIIVSFLLLALSGLPLKFAGASWTVPLANLLGGAEMAAWWHRVAAIITFGYFAVHISSLVFGWFVKKERGYFWGWRSMTPQLKDAQDLWANFKYFLYMGPRPAFDRWAYWEKFDYLAVFWGVAMIGVSGLLLWFPGVATMFLPGWALNAAYVIHSDEALLATGFIFLFHFFHTHLRPESFPLDPVVFTGCQPLERLKDERPLEYQRLVATGQLESLYVPAPTALRMKLAYVFGFTAVAIGVVLAIGIFVGLLTGYGL